MKTNILATALALSDQDLLARIDALAGKEREATAELVAHLAALEIRPTAYAAEGYGSLFGYCTQALRLSEDAACTRIAAARLCRRFPLILDFLASGSMNLTSVRLLGPHLTMENHKAVLARATNRTRREIEALGAELAPRPDVSASVRKLPIPKVTPPSSPMPVQVSSVPSEAAVALAPSLTADPPAPPVSAAPVAFVPTQRPIIRASAPQRYRVQFTIGQETHDQLRRVQALLRREIPDGDPGVIFGRTLSLFIDNVERKKLAATARPRPGRPIRSRTDKSVRLGNDEEGPIRPGTDKGMRGSIRPGTDEMRRALGSRHVPAEVKRAVWQRDAGQCAFVSSTGQRCTEHTFLELHHVQPYATQGPATVANISLRCWRHNQYEAEMIFGPHGASTVREAGALRYHPLRD